MAFQPSDESPESTNLSAITAEEFFQKRETDPIVARQILTEDVLGNFRHLLNHSAPDENRRVFSLDRDVLVYARLFGLDLPDLINMDGRFPYLRTSSELDLNPSNFDNVGIAKYDGNRLAREIIDLIAGVDEDMVRIAQDLEGALQANNWLVSIDFFNLTESATQQAGVSDNGDIENWLRDLYVASIAINEAPERRIV